MSVFYLFDTDLLVVEVQLVIKIKLFSPEIKSYLQLFWKFKLTVDLGVRPMISAEEFYVMIK